MKSERRFEALNFIIETDHVEYLQVKYKQSQTFLTHLTNNSKYDKWRVTPTILWDLT